ncbi:hypothetical protein [Halostreptopolyspora alba]
MVAATGAVLALGGLLWAARRSAVARSLVPARVTGRSPDGPPRVWVTDSPGGSEAVLDRAVPGLLEGDVLMVRARATRPGEVGACPRPWNAYWLGLLCHGLVLLTVGAAAGLTRDADEELLLFVPLFGAVSLLAPFLMVGKVAGLVGFALRGTRVTGRIVGYRAHPFVLVNDLRAATPRVEYEFAGATRSAWSGAAYMSSLFTGRRIAVWVGDRSPADIMTVGTVVYSTGVITLVFGLFGAPVLLWSLLG